MDHVWPSGSVTTARLGLSYYQLGQHSRFVQSAAVRIFSERWVSDFAAKPPRGSHAITHGVDNVAFENPDGTKVLVVYNNSRAPSSFRVCRERRYIGYTLPGEATVTFTWH